MRKWEKVIFQKNNQWGKKYQVKELRRGFVINYLLAHEEILFYSEQNWKRVEKQKEQEEKKNLFLISQAQELAAKINNFSLTFTLNKDEKSEPFGSVSSKEILNQLLEAGFDFQKNQLLNFQPLHKLGENYIVIKIRDNITTQLKVIIK